MPVSLREVFLGQCSNLVQPFPPPPLSYRKQNPLVLKKAACVRCWMLSALLVSLVVEPSVLSHSCCDTSALCNSLRHSGVFSREFLVQLSKRAVLRIWKWKQKNNTEQEETIQPLDRNEGRANRKALGGFSTRDLQMIQFNSKVSVDV